MAWLVSIVQFLLIDRFLLYHDLHFYFFVLVLFMLDLMLYILFYFETGILDLYNVGSCQFSVWRKCSKIATRTYTARLFANINEASIQFYSLLNYLHIVCGVSTFLNIPDLLNPVRCLCWKSYRGAGVFKDFMPSTILFALARRQLSTKCYQIAAIVVL